MLISILVFMQSIVLCIIDAIPFVSNESSYGGGVYTKRTAMFESICLMMNKG
jgi:hypothetical protein